MFGKKKILTSEKIEENQEAQSVEEGNASSDSLESRPKEDSAETLPRDSNEKVLEIPLTDSKEIILEKPEENSEDSDTASSDEAPNVSHTDFSEKELFPLLQDIQKRLGFLEDTFQQKLMRSAQEEKILDSMHEELQKYRADLYANQLRPILSELCNICDSIIRHEEFYKEKARTDGMEEPLIPLRLLADYVFDLQDLMVNNNVLVYRTKKGTSFDPAKHRVIKKVKTEEKDLHGKIAESHSNGYLYCGRTLSPEKISVYYFENSIEKAESAEGEQQ